MQDEEEHVASRTKSRATHVRGRLRVPDLLECNEVARHLRQGQTHDSNAILQRKWDDHSFLPSEPPYMTMLLAQSIERETQLVKYYSILEEKG